MKLLAPLVILGLLAAPAALAQPQRRGEQGDVFEARRNGRVLPLPEIERRVVPTMGDAQYLGIDFDSQDGMYTLKFLRDGAVIWVIVDGRTGQIVRRVGR